MNTIIFATSNDGKVATLKRALEDAGVMTAIEQKTLELIEPQADTALEVARSKAMQAYRLLHQPVLVDDSSFHIEALRGFPGPYIKYMQDTVGVDGIIEFMEGKTNRNAYFTSHLVYIDQDGEEFCFSDAPYYGTIALAVDATERAKAWGPLWKIFIPSWTDKTLSQLSTKRRNAHNSAVHEVDAYEQFALWLKNKK
ncbi:MAG: non-canonical purine NTP pyrophosphatase [Candidatus Saccharimonas sp.]